MADLAVKAKQAIALLVGSPVGRPEGGLLQGQEIMPGWQSQGHDSRLCLRLWKEWRQVSAEPVWLCVTPGPWVEAAGGAAAPSPLPQSSSSCSGAGFVIQSHPTSGNSKCRT